MTAAGPGIDRVLRTAIKKINSYNYCIICLSTSLLSVFNRIYFYRYTAIVEWPEYLLKHWSSIASNSDFRVS